MKQYYETVLTSKEMPKQSGQYHVDGGYMYFDIEDPEGFFMQTVQGRFYPETPIKYWIRPVGQSPKKTHLKNNEKPQLH